MILKASQRAGGTQLAIHLLNDRDNDHVEVHELRGFVSNNLAGAFKEAYAVSTGTKCRQFLFSLSLSPPERETVPVEDFENAITEIEGKIGLTDQPRAIVFHEKEGRRHAHCVWSRIDASQMKAINLPHFKLKLRDMSRQLYLEHGWQMPRGLMNSEERNPLNFTIEEWQQAKRAKRDPQALKEMFRECWAVSDTKATFANALEERGFYLARGDRRGHVAVDWQGEVYAVSRYAGVKAKDVRARLGDANDLPSVAEVKQQISERLSEKLKTFQAETESRHERQLTAWKQKRADLVTTQRQARDKLRQSQKSRHITETKIRASRLPTGIKALWFRITGKYQKIRKQNEDEAQAAEHRYRLERQKLIQQQLTERRALQHDIRLLRHHHEIFSERLRIEVKNYPKVHERKEKGDEEFKRPIRKIVRSI